MSNIQSVTFFGASGVLLFLVGGGGEGEGGVMPKKVLPDEEGGRGWACARKIRWLRGEETISK